MNFQTKLQRALEDPNLSPDKNGVYAISLGNPPLYLKIEQDQSIVPNTYLLQTQIRKADPEEVLDILKDLGPAVVSVHPETDMLTLHQRIPEEIPEESLKQLLKAFVEQTVGWMEPKRTAPPTTSTICPFTRKV